MEIKRTLDAAFEGLILHDETHTYTLGSKKLSGSVSSLVKYFHLPFPENALAKKAKKLGISEEQLAQEWKEINEESTTRGTRVHLFGETYPYNKELQPSCPQEEAVVKFWSELPKHIMLVGVEIKMYHKTYMFPGTMDLLLYDTINNHYIIADYKTNKDIYKNFQGQRMLPPFNNLLDSPLNHYQLQFSFYQILLEQVGIHVGQRLLIWLGLDGNYTMISTEDLTSKLQSFLRNKYENG